MEGNSTGGGGGGGVAATYPQTDCFNLGARKNTCAPRRGVGGGGRAEALTLSQCRSYGFPRALTPVTQSASSCLRRRGTAVLGFPA